MKSKYFVQGVLFILFSMLLILACHGWLSVEKDSDKSIEKLDTPDILTDQKKEQGQESSNISAISTI